MLAEGFFWIVDVDSANSINVLISLIEEHLNYVETVVSTILTVHPFGRLIY